MTRSDRIRSRDAAVWLAALVGLGVGCSSAEPAASTPASTVTEARPVAPAQPPQETPDCDAFADWRGERIELPPEFASSLPAGHEDLRFAPGMFKADAEDFFTYGFILAFKDASLDRGSLEQILDVYYRGLMKAVADGKKQPLSSEQIEHIKAAVTGSGDSFQARVAAHDAFVTGEAITLNMDMTVQGTCVSARVSPQPREHAVWRSLEQVMQCLPCP